MESALRLESLSLGSLLLNLGLGLIVSAVVALFYAYFGESLSNRPRFARLLPLLSLTTVLVISIVKASLALSLGLVGALSIVRFRTAIKDPEELLYLFLAIAIGLGFGADQRLATLVAIGFILILLAARRLVAPRSQRRNLFLNIHAPEIDEDGTPSFKTVNDIVGRYARYVDLRRLDRQGNGVNAPGTLQVTYLLDCRNQGGLTELMEALHQALPACSYSIVDRNSLPES